MKTRSYYAYKDTVGINACSRESFDAPIIVNCAGNFNTVYPFRTDNPAGRLDYYLMYITSGSLEFSVDGTEVTVGAGDTVVFPPKYGYSYTYHGGESLNYMWVHFTGSAAEFYLKETGLYPFPTVCHSLSDSHAGTSFNALFDRFGAQDSMTVHSLGAHLLQILTEIGRSLIHGVCNPVSRSLRFIDAHYADSIRIPDLAAMENLSNSRYHTVFKQAVGKSPIEYIMELRLKHAAELLCTTDMSVKQIGALVGYNDAPFFSKLFYSRFGTSPGKYRKRG